MKVGAQDSGVTLKEVFSGRLSPELKLTLEIGKIHLTLPRNKDFWTLQDSDEVVWNKKPISLAGRNGRYVRYRLMFGPFMLTESKLMEPLVYRGGKGHPTGQGWRLNRSTLPCVPLNADWQEAN
jgi:hypothetical protein